MNIRIVLSFFFFFFIWCIVHGYIFAERRLEDPQSRVQTRSRGGVVGRGLGTYAEINSGPPVSQYSQIIDSPLSFDFYYYVYIFCFFFFISSFSSSYLKLLSVFVFFFLHVLSFRLLLLLFSAFASSWSAHLIVCNLSFIFGIALHENIQTSGLESLTISPPPSSPKFCRLNICNSLFSSPKTRASQWRVQGRRAISIIITVKMASNRVSVDFFIFFLIWKN